MKNVVVAGGTGFIGSALCGALLNNGCSVLVLTRQPRRGMGPLRCMTWLPEDVSAASTILAPEMERADAVVNLAGEPVAGRWTPERKKAILNSRLAATRTIIRAMEMAGKKPAVLVNASAVGYYGTRNAALLDESAAPGADFLAQVCRLWEEEARKAEALGLRVALPRIGVVLGKEGGALPRMLPPFRLGLGGPLGSGDQWMSWIHVRDLVSLILWLLENQAVSGPVNAVSPNPATNGEFSRTLARALKRPCLFKVPAFALRAAFGEMSSMLLEGQRAEPKAALTGGFQFKFPVLAAALGDVLG